MIRDEGKMVQVTGAQKPVLHIFTAAGKQLGSLQWEQERIAAMAWTAHEDLMVLDLTGEVVLLPSLLSLLQTFISPLF